MLAVDDRHTLYFEESGNPEGKPVVVLHGGPGAGTNARMRQFHEILCATGGRYIRNPRDCGDVIRCDYVTGDHLAQTLAWRRITEDVREIRKDQWWRRMLRRMFSNA